jgi:AraC-like DNA-binding protein
VSRSPATPPWTPRADAGRIAYQPRAAARPPGRPSPELAERVVAPVVLTLLAADERARVDAAGQGRYEARHADALDALDALASALHRGPVGALLVSVAALEQSGARWVPRLAALTRAHPALPAVALVSGDVALATVFVLGRCGLRAVVDVRHPEGWALLRQTLGAAARPAVAQLAADRLAPALADTSDDTRRFVATLFAAPPRLATVRDLARTLGVLPTTLMSRFFRTRLPAPKRYLAYARLARAADLLAYGGWPVAAAADYMDYSSAQGFSRHLFLLMGVRPAEFRRRFTPEMLLDRFADDLLAPHQAALRDFWLVRR